MATKKTKGLLILEKIEFDQVYKRRVGKNNDSSGKITLPYNLIGKHVYVVVEPDKK
jgi:putative transposon-encoded protein